VHFRRFSSHQRGLNFILKSTSGALSTRLGRRGLCARGAFSSSPSITLGRNWSKSEMRRLVASVSASGLKTAGLRSGTGSESFERISLGMQASNYSSFCVGDRLTSLARSSETLTRANFTRSYSVPAQSGARRGSTIMCVMVTSLVKNSFRCQAAR